MAILTIQQRFNNSKLGKQTLKDLQDIKQKQQHPPIDWKTTRNLDSKDLMPLANIMIDDEGQRPPFENARVNKLKRMAKDPCPYLFKRVILSEREDGTLVVVEGQGRCLVAYALGMTQVPYDLYIFDSLQDEKDFFKQQNANVHSISGWNKHWITLNNVTDKHHGQANDMEKIVNACNLYYDPSSPIGTDATSCFTGIKDCMLKFEPTSKKYHWLPIAKAGHRNCDVTIGIINLMIKYGNGEKLKGDLFYPFAEFVWQSKGTKNDFTKALKKLDKKLASLENTLSNLPVPRKIGIQEIFDSVRLTGKSNKARLSVWKEIKKW